MIIPSIAQGPVSNWEKQVQLSINPNDSTDLIIEKFVEALKEIGVTCQISKKEDENG